MSKNKTELSVLVAPVEIIANDGPSTFYELQFCVIDDKEKGKIRNVGSDKWSDLRDLHFRLWISWSGGIFSNTSYEMAYSRPYKVDLERAELMVKTLRKINNIVKRSAEPGTAKTFGEFVTLVCAGLKIKNFVERLSPCRGWHADNDYRIADISGLAACVDGYVQMVKQENIPAEVAK